MANTVITTQTPEELNADQRHRLQQMWLHLLRICGVVGSENATLSGPLPELSSGFSQCLNGASPEEIRHGLWGSVMLEDPDTLLLRFLKARKWDVEMALTMLISAIVWRSERQLDEVVIRNGENVGLQQDLSEEEKGFITQYRSGKSYVRGVDKEGRLVYVIKVRLHDPNKQSSRAMETYVLHNIESLRLLMRSPNDKCCLIFDMTGFGLKNMDFHVVKFLVSVFEARYPETLGVVLIHNAPFVFWGVWNIIKGMLDQVVVSKINFTRKTADLLKFIPAENLQTCYGGSDAWEYQYAEPIPGENSRLEQVEKRAEIQKDRDVLIQEFEAKSIRWASSDIESSAAEQSALERSKIAELLRANYWQLDPYIRARTYHQREGIVDDQGRVDFKAARR